MQSSLKLAKFRGIICVCETSTRTDKPEGYTHYWPTNKPAGDFTDDELAAAQIIRTGYDYSAKIPGIGFWIELRLPQGGQTKSVHIDNFAIPCPKVRQGIETRWNNGAWQKRLASGWKTV